MVQPTDKAASPSPPTSTSSSVVNNGSQQTSFYRADTCGETRHPPLSASNRSTASSSAMARPSGTVNRPLSRAQSWVSSSSSMHANAAASSRFQHDMDASSKLKLEDKMAQAAHVVDRFFSPKLVKDQSIPQELLAEAHGLVFLTVYKAGFLFAGKIGTGFVISRTTSGWSAPCFLSSGGIGFGMMAGGEVVNYMVILSSRSAVKVFTRNGQFQLGSELDLAVGPVGRAASASVNIGREGFAPNYSYSHSVGLYGGVGLSSAIIATRKTLNAKFYGRTATARQILGGEVPCELAYPLWRALDRAQGIDREYRNGFPVFNVQSSGLNCDKCHHENESKSTQCQRCGHFLVYSIGVHSGRRQTSDLVVTMDHSQAAA